MADRPALAPRLRELDDTLAARGMPPGARARVAQRLRQEALRREATSGFRFRWLPALTFAAGAALMLAVVSLQLGPPRHASPSARATPSVFGGVFSVHGEGCRHRERAPEVELEGTCRLAAPHLSVHTWDRVRLRHERNDDDGAVRLLDGTAMFDVTEVAAGTAPTRILVSHGVIEVLGTRFTIEQGPVGGHVDLFEGRIRFVDLRGVVTEIAPGQRHAWGDAVAARSLETPEEPADRGRGASGSPVSADEATTEAHAPSSDELDDAHGAHETSAADQTALVEAATSKRRAGARGDAARGGAVRRAASRRKPPEPDDAARRAASRREPPEPDDATASSGTREEATAIIDAVTRLRAQGRYAEAADVLRRADRERRWDARTAQVLSYELGEIIERHLGDREAACAHWARHAERWAAGRYARAVGAAQERLGCAAARSPSP